MAWIRTTYTELEVKKDEIQTLLNKGVSVSEISRIVKCDYSFFAEFIEAESMIPWPELSDLERCTFVDFVKSRVPFDGKTRMITKTKQGHNVMMSAAEYVRYHCLMQAMLEAQEDPEMTIQDVCEAINYEESYHGNDHA